MNLKSDMNYKKTKQKSKKKNWKIEKWIKNFIKAKYRKKNGIMEFSSVSKGSLIISHGFLFFFFFPHTL